MTTVTRKVDTVIIEMDIDVAEKLVEILMLVADRTTRDEQINDLRIDLMQHADIRWPSPLYDAVGCLGYTLLKNRI